MRLLRFTLTAAVAGLAAAPPALSTVESAAPPPTAPDFVPGEVIVGFENRAGPAERERALAAAGVTPANGIGGDARTADIRDGETVARTVVELRDQTGVEYAVPNYRTRVARFTPNDPGREAGGKGDWREIQWNFDGPASVDARRAWEHAKDNGGAGGEGVKVAVLDSGVAYLDRGRYKRAPDLSGKRWVDGRDYIDGDRVAYDENDDDDDKANLGMGHGTHVAGTIRQATDNERAVTGLAYRAKVMPVRVLDTNGGGDTAALAEGIRFAARNGADVINMSLEVTGSGASSGDDPLSEATRYAHKRGAVLVAAAGNRTSANGGKVTAPAALRHVIAVGATTESGCQAEYSNGGQKLDLVAPGGGDDAPLSGICDPSDDGRPVFQQTFDCSPHDTSRCTSFGLPDDYDGTSMSAPHASATAALLIASGHDSDPKAIEERLEDTATDLGAPGRDDRYGAGRLDAGAAVP